MTDPVVLGIALWAESSPWLERLWPTLSAICAPRSRDKVGNLEIVTHNGFASLDRLGRLASTEMSNDGNT